MQKFRLWDKENKVMIAWEQYKHEMVADDFENDLLVVMPYIGRKDKNDAEIYDGDIATIDSEDWICVITWDNDTCRYLLDVVTENVAYDFDNFYSKDLEVIGNIYEKPELLEASLRIFMKINSSKITNPYFMAFVKVHGLKDGDDIPTHKYLSWIDKKHAEFRKMKGCPYCNGYSPDVQDEFENFILERRSQ